MNNLNRDTSKDISEQLIYRPQKVDFFFFFFPLKFLHSSSFLSQSYKYEIKLTK